MFPEEKQKSANFPILPILIYGYAKEGADPPLSELDSIMTA